MLCEGHIDNFYYKKCHPQEAHGFYYDVRHRSTKDVPRCDVFITGPPSVVCAFLGQRKGTSSSQGRLLLHSFQSIVQKLPRVVITRGYTALLAHVKERLRGLHYPIHIRILCTSQSAVPQSRGRCYMVGIRGPKVG
ncbi:MAG: DNA cytosine methyltransferase, partial [Candidatus Fonsibacter sp.]